MLVAFIGVPCSGKTSTAARVFADLKDAGYPAEFLPEYARTYIANRRLSKDISPLNDNDQACIMYQQLVSEEMMTTSSPDSIIIADSAALNALIYMTPEFQNQPKIQENARKITSRYSVIFRCHPVHPGSTYDINRVHNFEQSLALDTKVEPLLYSFGLTWIDLHGEQKHRAIRAYGAVLEEMVKEVAR